MRALYILSADFVMSEDKAASVLLKDDAQLGSARALFGMTTTSEACSSERYIYKITEVHLCYGDSDVQKMIADRKVEKVVECESLRDFLLVFGPLSKIA